MSNSYGENLKLSIFGTSHGPSIGMTLEGIPAGLPIDLDKLQLFLNRRAPGQNAWSTARKEPDVPVFESGIENGFTTGETIRAVIYNQNVRSKDYDELKYIPRPGHADYTAWMKYGLDYDMAGGGPFSGRMTAPMCIAGGLCKQWLEAKGIRIGAHISLIGGMGDDAFDPVAPQLDHLDPLFPVLNESCAMAMHEAITQARKNGDSVGGIVECAVTGLPAGIGGELFGGVESHIAQIVYSIPAVKGVNFGYELIAIDGKGSFCNDPYILEDSKVTIASNFSGGILGGITNGMPLIFNTYFKPTPSIALPQKSVNLKTMEEVTIQINGRHDPCIVPRAVPVVESAAAIAIYDLILGNNRND